MVHQPVPHVYGSHPQASQGAMKILTNKLYKSLIYKNQIFVYKETNEMLQPQYDTRRVPDQDVPFFYMPYHLSELCSFK